jgi:hypothetical protein
MFKSLKVILGAGFILSATAAAADGLPPEVLDNVMQTCRADYHRVCSEVVPGGGRVGRCLLDHETELAPPCLKAIKIAYAIEACMPDFRRFCNGVAPGGGQIVECLADRIEQLAPECRRVVSANAPYASPGRERYGFYRERPSGEAYPYSPRPEGEPYADGAAREQPYEDRYADRGYDRYAGPGADRYAAPGYDRYADRGEDRYREQRYGEERYPERGYDAPPPPYAEEEREPIK